jgi:hypothetical protein
MARRRRAGSVTDALRDARRALTAKLDELGEVSTKQ